jgi:hypothetical protein
VKAKMTGWSLNAAIGEPPFPVHQSYCVACSSVAIFTDRSFILFNSNMFDRLGITKGLQVLLGAMITALSAVTSGKQVSLTLT